MDLNAGLAEADASDASDADLDSSDVEDAGFAGTSTPIRHDSDSEADVRRVVRAAKRRLLASSDDEDSDFEDTGVEAVHTHVSEEEDEDL